MQIARDHDRDVHLQAYRNAYEQSWCALRSPVGYPTLAQTIAPRPAGAEHVAATSLLRGILGTRFSCEALPDAGGAPDIERIVDVLVAYLREEQAILASTTVIQESINVLLDRPRPKRLLSARDLLAMYLMASGLGAFPYLLDAVEDELGIRVECTENAINIADLRSG